MRASKQGTAVLGRAGTMVSQAKGFAFYPDSCREPSENGGDTARKCGGWEGRSPGQVKATDYVSQATGEGVQRVPAKATQMIDRAERNPTGGLCFQTESTEQRGWVGAEF